MPSWPFQLEGKVFDGVEVIPASHVDVEDKIFNPDTKVCRSVICLYVHGFESLWKFVIQHLIGEAHGVHSPSVSGQAAACCRLLLCPVLIPNWYPIGMIVLVTIVLHRDVSFRSIDGPSRTGFFIQELA